METLVQLKDFLADRPEVAFLAISLMANVALFGFYVRANDARVKTLMMILPLATRLSDLLALAANKAKARNPSSIVVSESGIRAQDTEYNSPAYDHLRGDKP